MLPRYFKWAAMNQSVQILNLNYYLWDNGYNIYQSVLTFIASTARCTKLRRKE